MRLTDRYVYAVTKLIPAQRRQEVESKVRALIEEMIAKRGGYSDANEEAVLKELGNSRQLADKYLDRPHYLIGPEIYDAYVNLLKIIVPIAIVATLIGNTIEYIVDGKEVLTYFLSIFAGIFNAAISAFGGVTIIFAIIERKGSGEFIDELKRDWKPADLPGIEKQQKPISRVGTTIGIAFTILFMVLLNRYIHLVGVYYTEGGTLHFIPALDAALFRSFLPFINGIIVLQILLSIAKLIYNKWNYPFAAANLIINALNMVVALMILGHPHIIDFTALAKIPGLPADLPVKGFEFIRTVLQVILPFAFAIDSFEGFRNAYKASKGL